MATAGISSITLFTLARDAAFFKALFFSADRENELAVVKTQEILRFPEDDGLLFNHVWGETKIRQYKLVRIIVSVISKSSQAILQYS